MGTLVGWYLLAAFAGSVIVVISIYNLVATKLKLATLKRKFGELQEYVDAVEARLQLARELNAGDAKAISEVRAEVARLRTKIAAKTEPAVDETNLKGIEASAAALAITNHTTNHILHAENLAIGDIENKPKRLERRPHAPSRRALT